MTDKKILIIGSERGLGLGLAQEFNKRGWIVTGTARMNDSVSDLESCASIQRVDILDRDSINHLCAKLKGQIFDVIYMNAGVFGPLHQSTLEATDEEIAVVLNTNAIGPIRIARMLMNNGNLKQHGALCFMTSHRGSVSMNIEGGLELYRASKAALNIMARGLYAELKSTGITVLNIHPGWAATSMGTLDGKVSAEISVNESVEGVATVVEKYMGGGENLYVDYSDKIWSW